MHMLATPAAPQLAQNALPVHRADVREIDFLRESAQLTIYFHPTFSGRAT